MNKFSLRNRVDSEKLVKIRITLRLVKNQLVTYW